MGDEDPVVQEVPVFLSQGLAKNLYIYQFPTRPANKDWNETKVVNCSIKPKNQILKLEFGVDTYSDKYCTSKGEQIALNTDGNQDFIRNVKEKDKEKGQYFKSGIMDKILFESSTPCPNTDHYAIAILQDKELHCTPINGIVQLRPSFSYFDKQDKRKKDSDDALNSDEEEEEPEAQQVTVKFARQETDVIKKAREKSYEFISKKTAEEPWCSAMWNHSDSDQADLERLKLFSACTSSSVSLSMRSRDYIRALVPPAPPEETDSAPHRRSLYSMPLTDQCRGILLDAKVMPFNELRALLRTESGPPSETALLSALGAAACCVRGLWAARSSDLFTQPSSNSGVPPHLMCAARDYILYLFTQSSYVDRRKITAAVRLPPIEVLEIIKTVAKFNAQTGWELILPPDTAFEAKYPNVVQRQNLYWEAKQRQFNEMLLGETITRRQRKKSQRDSFSSDSMLSPKPRCNSVSEDDSDGRKRMKNKSATGSGKRTRHISSSSGHEAT